MNRKLSPSPFSIVQTNSLFTSSAYILSFSLNFKQVVRTYKADVTPTPKQERFLDLTQDLKGDLMHENFDTCHQLGVSKTECTQTLGCDLTLADNLVLSYLGHTRHCCSNGPGGWKRILNILLLNIQNSPFWVPFSNANYAGSQQHSGMER